MAAGEVGEGRVVARSVAVGWTAGAVGKETVAAAAVVGTAGVDVTVAAATGDVVGTAASFSSAQATGKRNRKQEITITCLTNRKDRMDHWFGNAFPKQTANGIVRRENCLPML
jgi:hypothetical protein